MKGNKRGSRRGFDLHRYEERLNNLSLDFTWRPETIDWYRRGGKFDGYCFLCTSKVLKPPKDRPRSRDNLEDFEYYNIGLVFDTPLCRKCAVKITDKIEIHKRDSYVAPGFGYNIDLPLSSGDKAIVEERIRNYLNYGDIPEDLLLHYGSNSDSCIFCKNGLIDLGYNEVEIPCAPDYYVLPVKACLNCVPGPLFNNSKEHNKSTDKCPNCWNEYPITPEESVARRSNKTLEKHFCPLCFYKAHKWQLYSDYLFFDVLDRYRTLKCCKCKTYIPDVDITLEEESKILLINSEFTEEYQTDRDDEYGYICEGCRRLAQSKSTIYTFKAVGVIGQTEYRLAICRATTGVDWFQFQRKSKGQPYTIIYDSRDSPDIKFRDHTHMVWEALKTTKEFFQAEKDRLKRRM